MRGLLVAAVLVMLVSASGEAGAALSYLGTWTVPPAASTPWPNGGTLTISSASKSAVEPYRTSSGAIAWCLGSDQLDPKLQPRVSAFYSLKYTWRGGGTMGGCVSDKTNGLVYFGKAAINGSAFVRGDGALSASWCDDPQRCVYGFIATKSAAESTRTVTEPAPGGSTTVSSPSPLPEDRTVETTVTSSDGDLNGTTVVGSGGRTVAQASGEAVAACWLIGPDALVFNKDEQNIKDYLDHPRVKKAWAGLDPKAQLEACIALVRWIAGSIRTPQGTAESAAGCRTQRLTVAITTRGGRVTSVRLGKKPLTPTSIKYTCSGKAGSEKVRIDGRQKGGLRRALGPKLRLGVVRAKSAAGARAKLTFGYSF